jgi:hypothetical protein
VHSYIASRTRSLKASFDLFVVPFGRPPLLEVPCECPDSFFVYDAFMIMIHGLVGASDAVIMRSLVGVSDAVGIVMRDEEELTDDESAIPDTTVWC